VPINDHTVYLLNYAVNVRAQENRCLALTTKPQVIPKNVKCSKWSLSFAQEIHFKNFVIKNNNKSSIRYLGTRLI